MESRPKSVVLLDQGLALWEQGKLKEARERYEEALAVADPNHYRMPDHHAQYAGVLSALDENEAAEEQYRLAISAELRQTDDPNSSSVTIARYFQANHLLSKGKAQEAIDAIAGHVEAASECQWLLLLIQAESFHTVGRTEEAKKSAISALELAPSDEKRSELNSIFIEQGILEGRDG